MGLPPNYKSINLKIRNYFYCVFAENSITSDQDTNGNFKNNTNKQIEKLIASLKIVSYTDLNFNVFFYVNIFYE